MTVAADSGAGPGNGPTDAAAPANAAPGPRQTTAYLKELFAAVGFTLDPRRGQNFLVDLNLLDVLVRTAAIDPADVVLEVGTGTAALTERLARAAAAVVTVEIDRRLAQLARDRLADAENVTLVEGDVLARKHRLAPEVLATVTAALAGSRGRLLLVANLPYCVATPVISNLLALPRPFDAAVVTVQRELAERMTSLPGSPHYNALSVWIGAQCRGTIQRVLPPSVFWPRPQVESAIVRLDLEPQRRAAIADLAGFHSFIRDLFCHRRKLLRGVLIRMAGGRKDVVDAMMAAAGIRPEARAEEIAPDGLVALAELFSEIAQTP